MASALVVVAYPGDNQDHLKLVAKVGCSALYFMLYQEFRGDEKLELHVPEVVLQLLQDDDKLMSATRRSVTLSNG